MSDHDYKLGRRDGQELTYNPPVKERIFTSYTDEERQRRDDYYQGFVHGKGDREKGKK